MEHAKELKLTIRKDDQVQVISGREKGKVGKVLRVDSKNQRITVEKVNLAKRHVKPSQKNPQGGVLEKEASLHYSNVLLHCAKCGRGVRHGFKLVEPKGSRAAERKAKKGKAAASQAVKTRVCKRCGEALGAGG